ncbi:MAG: GNAT family N-acetyltransferase [Candidatus Promineifilaceae bacterium]
MSLEIELVSSDKQLKEFIKVPWAVYKDDPTWVPFLYFERVDFFDKNKNPFFEHAEADYFIARRDGRPVGTIAAILNHRHNEFHEENVAHFGVFEVMNDPEAAAALLQTACDWAKERGTDRILGPFNLSTNDECGLLIEGFDDPPMILMTYNPPYYMDFLETAGFHKAMDLYAWLRDGEALAAEGGVPEKLVRVINKVKDRYGLTVRQLNRSDWDHEVEGVKAVYNDAWLKNWGFVPMTDGEINRLAEGLKPIVDEQIAFMVEKDGKPVGFSLTLPDISQLLHQFHPGPSLLSSYAAIARVLFTLRFNKTKVNRARVIAFGVKEDYRVRGVDGLMLYETAKRAAPNGYKWLEASWILETNDKMNQTIELFGAHIYKKYRIYEKQLA